MISVQNDLYDSSSTADGPMKAKCIWDQISWEIGHKRHQYHTLQTESSFKKLQSYPR